MSITFDVNQTGGLNPAINQEQSREEKAALIGALMLDIIESTLDATVECEPGNHVDSPHDWLFVEDIRALFKCGDSKARAILHALPSQRIGKRNAVQRKDLEDYIEEHGGVKAK